MGRNKGSKNISKKVMEIIYDEIKRCPKDTNRDVIAIQIENHPYFITGYGVTPSHETLIKKISEISGEIDRDPESHPWNLGSLTKMPNFPREALPTIMQLAEIRRQTDDDLTIREAKWISWLFPLIKPTKIMPVTEVLNMLVARYARQEEMFNFMKISFGTANLDTTILKDYEEYVSYPFLYSQRNLDLLKYCIKLRSEAVNRTLSDSEKELLAKVDELHRNVTHRDIRIEFSRKSIDAYSKKDRKDIDGFIEQEIDPLEKQQVKIEKLARAIGVQHGIKVNVRIPQPPPE